MKKISILTMLSLALCANPVFAAGSVTGTQKATATLTSFCSLTTQPINFGNITSTVSTNETANATGTISVLCSKSTAYSIALNLGAYGNTSVGRLMNGATLNEKLGYVICTTATVAANGNCNSGTFWYNSNIVSSTGTGSQQNFPTYGFVSKGYYSPDNYSDTITATVTY